MTEVIVKERIQQDTTSQFIYYIKDEGVIYFAQTSSENILFDWKHCAILGFLFGKDSSFNSFNNGVIVYTEYISDETKNLIKKYVAELSTITKDSFDTLAYEYKKYRSFLNNQGMVYEKYNSTLPLFFNEITNRNCIYAFAKALVLNNMDATTELYWNETEHDANGPKIKIKLKYESITESLIDIFQYAGILKPDYSETASQYFSDDNYYIVFEDWEDGYYGSEEPKYYENPKKNLCSWLLDQTQGFFADVAKIDDPRGNIKEETKDIKPELQQISGYVFDDENFPQNNTIEYDGKNHQMPSVVPTIQATPEVSSVDTYYRKIESSDWIKSLSNPFSNKNVGSYVIGAKIAPKPIVEELYRPSILYFNLIINKRSATVIPTPRTVPYTGNEQTLSAITIDNLAENEIIKQDNIKFTDSFDKPGTYQVTVVPDSFDIGYEDNGIFISTKNNYILTYQSGTLTIEQEDVTNVDVPQKVFTIPALNDTVTQISIITESGLKLYKIPFIPSVYQQTCIINSVEFYVTSTSSGECWIEIGFGKDDDSMTWCYNDSPNVTPGFNKINLTTPYSVTNETTNFVYFGISATNNDFTINGFYPLKSNFAKAGYSPSGSEDAHDWVSSDVPKLNFYRSINGPSDYVIDFIEGNDKFYSNIIPFTSSLSYEEQNNNENENPVYTNSSSVLYWFVKKEEISFIGTKLNKISLIQKEPNNFVTPLSINLSLLPVYDGSEFINEDGGFSVEAENGIIKIDDSSFIDFGSGIYEALDTQNNIYSVSFDNTHNRKILEDGVGYIFRLESNYHSAPSPVKAQLNETAEHSSSYWNVVLLNNGGSINNDECLIPIDFRPSMMLYYNIPNDSSEVNPTTPEIKKTCQVWFPELLTLGSEPPYTSVTDEFKITGTGCNVVEFNDIKQFKIDASTGFIEFLKSDIYDYKLKNIRQYRLSFNAFTTNPDGADIYVSFNNNHLPIHVSSNISTDIYKYVSWNLLPTENGYPFVCNITNYSNYDVYISNICLILNFIE